MCAYIIPFCRSDVVCCCHVGTTEPRPTAVASSHAAYRCILALVFIIYFDMQANPKLSPQQAETYVPNKRAASLVTALHPIALSALWDAQNAARERQLLLEAELATLAHDQILQCQSI